MGNFNDSGIAHGNHEPVGQASRLPVGAASSRAFDCAQDARRTGRQDACPASRFTGSLLFLILTFLALAVGAQTFSSLNLPLYFEANPAQTEFRSCGDGYQFLISPAGVQIALRESGSRAATARMEFAGANALASIQGQEELSGKVNYLIGNDPSKWQTGLPTFARIRIAEIYPGINLVFHGNQQRLEYDFAIAPGANPNTIKIRFDGVDKISLTPQGELVLTIGKGEIRQPAPEIYQIIGGARKLIGGGYIILDARTVAFKVANYDHSLPLVIDPVLNYSAFFGGNNSNTGWAIALGTNDCVYVAGQTISENFFTTGAYQTNFAGGAYLGDAFIAKFGNPATNLIYLTYLGGSSDDAAFSLAVDSGGNAFVAGWTDSTDFPTNNALYPELPTPYDPLFNSYPGSGFVSELNTNGTKLKYSTYLGGTRYTAINGIAVDSSDNAYVAGFTYAANFPVTTNAFQEHLACSNNVYLNANGFVTEIASNDASLLYSTYLGGTNYDVATAIALDSSNNVYVAGYTASYNFPVWKTPTNLPGGQYLNGVTNRPSFNYTFDGFTTKFPPLATKPSSVTNLVYSTFLGGTNNDMAYGIAADGAGNAYVTGWTSSTNFPVMNTPSGLFSFLTTNGNNSAVATNAFLTKISANGSNVLDSAVFGGNAQDIGFGVAVDSSGDAFVMGSESSTNFPTMNTSGSLLATNSSTTGGFDVFVAGFNANWLTMYYSVCLGGINDSFGYGIALDASTNVFITGQTDSTNYPTQNAARYWFNGTNYTFATNYINGANFSGNYDAFVSEISLAPLPAGPVITNLFSVTNGVGATVSFSVGVTGTMPFTYQWLFGTNQANATNLLFNGGNINGTTSNVLTIANIQTTNQGIYTVIITNNWGMTTDSASLTVAQYPFITTPLTNQTVGIGSTVTFAVTAYGTPTLYYQWLTNGVVVTNGGQFSGATNNTLTLTDAQTNNSGSYEVIITNAFSPPATDSAMLTVLPAPVMSISLISNNIANGLNFNIVGAPVNYDYYLFGSSNLVVGPIAYPEWTNIGTVSFSSQGQAVFTLTPSEFPLMSSWTNGFFILQQLQ